MGWAGTLLAWQRIVAIMANASMTSETWHPCQERSRYDIKAQLIFRRLEAILDSSAAALHTHQLLDGGSCWSPGGEKGQLVIGDGAADQKTARPKPGEACNVIAGVDIGQFHISPVMEARPLDAIARRKTFPVRSRQALRGNDAIGADSRIEIELANGRRVRVGPGADMGALKRILEIADGRRP